MFRWLWCRLFHCRLYWEETYYSVFKRDRLRIYYCPTCQTIVSRVLLVLLALVVGVELVTPALAAIEQATIGGPVSPDGKRDVTCDLPYPLRSKNVGGRDGAGLCVFTSVQHSARYQNERRLWNFQRDMRQEPGGGWPEKLEAMIDKYGPDTAYVQYIGRDPAFLEAVLKTGRMVSITYTRVHMVNLIYLDQDWFAVLDNNYIGVNEIRWHRREEGLRMWTDGGQGWAVALLAPRPPAPPFNR